MYAGLTIAAVVPAYNEERLVGRTVETLPSCVDHVLLIDDGSWDGTVAEARAAGDGRLSVIQHPKNRGVGAAIVTGYERALALGADVCVVLGADGQMDPDEIVRLLEPIAVDDADYVKGNRLQHPELELRMPVTRRIGNRVLTSLTQAALRRGDLGDSQCGFTAINRRALERVPLRRVWPRYGYPNDLLAHLLERGLRVAERPVTPIYGDEESGIRPLREIPTFSFVLARAWLRARAIR